MPFPLSLRPPKQDGLDLLACHETILVFQIKLLQLFVVCVPLIVKFTWLFCCRMRFMNIQVKACFLQLRPAVLLQGPFQYLLCWCLHHPFNCGRLLSGSLPWWEAWNSRNSSCHLLNCLPPPEDILNGNHKQLRDGKGNVAHQETTNFIYLHDNSPGDM